MGFMSMDGKPRLDVPPQTSGICQRHRNCHWGYFDPTIPPVMIAESGDLIWAEAVTHHAGDDPELLMDPRWKRYSAISLTPIAIRAFI